MLPLIYRLLTDLGAPAIRLYLHRRLRQGREDPVRFQERLGIATLPRPVGNLIWCHAASVGEANSLLALIDKIHDYNATVTVLITTGTVSSARMLKGRLPSWALHQYVPVDRMPYIAKFLRHWRPNIALWIESELWPNMLEAIRKHDLPAALINGRMSEASFRNWYRVKGWSRRLLETFTLCFAQTEEDRSRLIALGASPVYCVGNLKYAAKALPIDPAALQQLQLQTAGRAIWLAASTHRGEEDIALEIHQKLKLKFPHLMTIITPRHAVRGQEIAQRIAASGLLFARRSQRQPLTAQTEIYLADTMGELGLFYRLAPLCMLGGSFVPAGGHNPIEPAQLDCAIVFGPYMHNFSAIAREFTLNRAAVGLQHINELALTIERLLHELNERMSYTLAAKLLAEQKQHVLQNIIEKLRPIFDRAGVKLT